MAVIADVHTAASEVLEVGVGHAAKIIVTVPIEDNWTLASGAVSSITSSNTRLRIA